LLIHFRSTNIYWGFAMCQVLFWALGTQQRQNRQKSLPLWSLILLNGLIINGINTVC
jgi:hypothetical protein